MPAAAPVALVAILTIALAGRAYAEVPPVDPAAEAPPEVPEAAPAPERAPAPPVATPTWTCVPYDAAPCRDGYRVCAADGSGWGACLAGDAPARTGERREQPLSVASWQRFSPGLQTLGVAVEIGGVLVGTIGLAQWADLTGKNYGPGPAALLGAGGGAFLSGLVIHYVGSLYTPNLEPSDRLKGAPATQRLAPYVGLAGAGVRGDF